MPGGVYISSARHCGRLAMLHAHTYAYVRLFSRTPHLLEWMQAGPACLISSKQGTGVSVEMPRRACHLSRVLAGSPNGKPQIQILASEQLLKVLQYEQTSSWYQWVM